MSTPKIRPWKEILASLELPGEERKKSGRQAPRGPRPWKEICAGIRMQTAASLLRKPMPGFFLGAASLADSMYLLWQGNQQMQFYPNLHKDGPLSYQEWVRFADRLVNEEEHDYKADGYTLLYRLLIEPFALMDNLTAGPAVKPESQAEVRAPLSHEGKQVV